MTNEILYFDPTKEEEEDFQEEEEEDFQSSSSRICLHNGPSGARFVRNFSFFEINESLKLPFLEQIGFP